VFITEKMTRGKQISLVSTNEFELILKHIISPAPQKICRRSAEAQRGRHWSKSTPWKTPAVRLVDQGCLVYICTCTEEDLQKTTAEDIYGKAHLGGHQLWWITLELKSALVAGPLGAATENYVYGHSRATK
jgi:hypothetical protein